MSIKNTFCKVPNRTQWSDNFTVTLHFPEWYDVRSHRCIERKRGCDEGTDEI